MYDYQNYQDSENNELEDVYVPPEYDPNRPRPMTSAEYHGGDDRRHANKFANQPQPFPTVGGNVRAASAKPYKATEKGQANTLKLIEKAHQGPRNQQGFVLQNNKLMQNPSADFARMRPKNIMQDKERLYEETLHLKSIVNGLKEENLRLKTKINNLEKEASKFEKMIQEANTTYYKDAPPGKTAENHLTLTLKQNVKELKSTLKKREDELLEIKKSMKYTKIQELEIQMKAFQDEAARLRTIMDHVMQEKAHVVMSDDDKNRLQEEYFIQATQLKTLKRDNEEMATAIKILEEQNFEYEKKITEQEKKLRREQNLHKKAVQEKEKELQRLKNDSGTGGSVGPLGQQGTNIKRPMTGVNRDDALRQELEKKTLENNNLINQLAEKRNQVLSLERQLRDLKTEYTEKVTSVQNEKQALLRELEKLKNAKASGPNEANKGGTTNELKVQELKLDDYARRASLQRAFSQEEKDSLLVYNPGNTNKGAQGDKKASKVAPRKRVQKVRPDDVKNIGYELNLRLRIKKLTFEEIDRVIWPEKIRKSGTISLKEMIDILKNDPFNMTNEDDIVLTARFLIEENEHEYLYYDDTVKNDLQIVRSILKKMIGHLPPWDEGRMKRMHDEISEICVNNYGGLRENLKALCKSGFLQAKDLKEACELIEVPISDEQVEYVITKLFEYSDNINKLSIDRLFEIFSLKPKDIAMDEGSPRTQSDSSPVVKRSTLHEEEEDFRHANKGQHAIREEDEDEEAEHGQEEGEEEMEDNEEEEEEGSQGEQQSYGEQHSPEKRRHRISERPGEEDEDYGSDKE